MEVSASPVAACEDREILDSELIRKGFLRNHKTHCTCGTPLMPKCLVFRFISCQVIRWAALSAASLSRRRGKKLLATPSGRLHRLGAAWQESLATLSGRLTVSAAWQEVARNALRPPHRLGGVGRVARDALRPPHRLGGVGKSRSRRPPAPHRLGGVARVAPYSSRRHPSVSIEAY